MRPRVSLILSAGCLLVAAAAFAAVFGTVSGTVEDVQHRPVPQADVTLKARLSTWQRHLQTNDQGRFAVPTVPVGEYDVTVTKAGFNAIAQRIVVRSGTVTALAVALPVGTVAETVEVHSPEGLVSTRSTTTATLVTRDELARTPGAFRTNSMDVVTQFVPGAYVIHDQLHIRGGHQVSWLVDGVPVPNTNIATTVGPQFDPKDIDAIEIQRGGLAADLGDRTFGVFNIVPRMGFERSREAELVANYGSFRETNDQFSLGNHTDRVAYYASLSASHTNLGLETPVAAAIHDRATSVGGFGSFNYRSASGNQIRLVGAVRQDHFQIPNTPEDQAAGVDDHQRERDGFVNLSWLHGFGSTALLTVSPFFHDNRAAFDGGPRDPIVTTDHRASEYIGAQAVLATTRGPHSAQVGVYGFYQRDDVHFGLESTTDGLGLSQQLRPTGHVAVAFVQDQFAAASWLTINAGLRATQFAGAITETAVSPRIGVALRGPHGVLVLRAFYGRYYQPPPLTTVTGPLLALAVNEGFGFLPVKGERDEQYEIGVAVPIRNWTIDVDYFHTNARNYFDHDVIGHSNIFLPVTIDRARIRGWEATIRSPGGGRAHLSLAYAHQFVEGRGAISGGLTSFEPPADGFFFLDHDQRDTLTTGVNVDVAPGAQVALTVAYGSGFLQGDGPAHKSAHAVVNVQASRAIGKQWTLIVSALNLGNTHFLLDETNTFGGTHFNNPRQFSAGFRYRFHY